MHKNLKQLYHPKILYTKLNHKLGNIFTYVTQTRTNILNIKKRKPLTDQSKRTMGKRMRSIKDGNCVSSLGGHRYCDIISKIGNQKKEG